MAMKTRLFNEYEAMTNEGADLLDRIEPFIQPEIERMHDAGFSLRDTQMIIEVAVQSCIANAIIRSGMAARKAKRQAV